MSLEVYHHLEDSLGVITKDFLLQGKYGWVHIAKWILEAFVKVLTQSIKFPVPTCPSIWINRWNNLKDIIIKQILRLDIAEISKFIEEALKHVGCRSGATMNSSNQKYHRFIKLNSIFRSQTYHVHWTAFQTLS